MKVPLAPPWWVCGGIGLAPFPPTRQRGKEGLHTRIAGMGVQLLAGEEPHQVLGFQPDALVADRAPEEDQGLGVQFTASMGQFIELGGLADVDPSHLVHALVPPAVCQDSALHTRPPEHSSSDVADGLRALAALGLMEQDRSTCVTVSLYSCMYDNSKVTACQVPTTRVTVRKAVKLG